MVLKKTHIFMEKIGCSNVSKEIWKDVIGYEGFYQISNLGNVKSLKRNTARERILKQRLDKYGYLYVNLTKNGIRRTFKVHRLVGIAFIPNPENKYSINHIDFNKANNIVDNLEWATHKEQIKHDIDNGLRTWSKNSKEKLRRTLIKKGLENINNADKRWCGTRPVVQKDDAGNVIKVWLSMSDASRELNIPVPHIVRVCRGRRKHAKGFVWEYYKGGDA